MENVVKVKKDDRLWLLRAEYRDLPGKIALDTLETAHQFKLIKKSHARLVGILTMDRDGHKENLLVKKYVLPGWYDVIRYTFQSSRARKEWRALNDAWERGLAVPQPVAMAEKRWFGMQKESFLVMKRIKNIENLHDLVVQNAGGQSYRFSLRERAELTRKLADFIKDVHHKGLIHQDLHAGNILVQRLPKQKYRFFLIDLHRARFVKKLSRKRCLRNLVEFNKLFVQWVNSTDRLRFCKRYMEGDDHFKKYARSIERETVRQLFSHWTSRARRCFRENKDFLPVSVGVYRGHAVKGWNALDEIVTFLQEPHALFTSESVRPIKLSRTTSIVSLPVTNSDGSKREVVIKRFNMKRWIDPLKSMFRQSRAFRCWNVANAMRIRAIATPMPVLAMERRRFGVLRDCYFLTERLEGCENLVEYVTSRFMPDKPAEGRRKEKCAFIYHCAREIARLHNHGVCLGDMKAGNILISNRRVFFTDLDTAYLRKSPAPKRVVYRNLMQLVKSFAGNRTVSLADMRRFLAAYAEHSLHDINPQHAWKAVASQVLERTKSNVVRFNGDGMKVVRPYQKLFGKHGLKDFLVVMNMQEGAHVCRNRRRSVLRFTIHDEKKTYAFYVKRHQRTGIKEIVADLLRGRMPLSDGMREWNTTHDFLASQVNTAHPVAVGESRCLGIPRESFFISEEIPDVDSVENISRGDIVLSHDVTSRKKDMIVSVAALVRKMHRCGLWHRDLYLKHILTGANSRENRYFIIDLQRAQSHRRLGLRKRTRDLATLYFSTPRRFVTNTGRMRFFKAYLEKHTLGTGDKNLIRKIIRYHGKLVSRRLSPDADIRVTSLDEGRVVLNAAYAELFQRNRLTSFRDIFGLEGEADGGRKTGRRVATVVLHKGRENGTTLCLKRHRGMRLIGPSAEKKEWKNIMKDRVKGHEAPIPVAYGEMPTGFLRQKSFLITQDIINTYRAPGKPAD